MLEQIVQRVGRHLERRGLLERDEEQAWLSEAAGEPAPLDGLLGASITYRIAVGPQRGERAFLLRTLPPADEDSATSDKVARMAGFSLHAGIAARADQRRKVERLCRYIAHPAVAKVGKAAGKGGGRSWAKAPTHRLRRGIKRVRGPPGVGAYFAQGPCSSYPSGNRSTRSLGPSVRSCGTVTSSMIAPLGIAF